MNVEQYVASVQTQLAAAAALGDEATRRVADALAVAAAPAIRLVVLESVSAAADEITAALLDAPGAPRVEVRLDGDEVRTEVRTSVVAPEPDAPSVESIDADTSARISLRLSEVLKNHIDNAARTDGISVNTWIVRALAAAVARPNGPGRPNTPGSHTGSVRMTGWLNG